MGWQQSSGWRTHGWRGAAAAGGGASAVVHEGNSTEDQSNTNTAWNFTSITMPTVSNGLLLIPLMFDRGGVGTVVSGLSLTWNGVALEQVGSTVSSTDNNTDVAIWALRNPAAGNQTLAASWTGSSRLYIFPAFFSNVNQTGGASTYGTPVTNTGTSNTASVSITGGTNDTLVSVQGASFANNTSHNQTLIALADGVNDAAIAQWATGTGSSVSFTATVSGSVAWCSLACDLKPV